MASGDPYSLPEFLSFRHLARPVGKQEDQTAFLGRSAQEVSLIGGFGLVVWGFQRLVLVEGKRETPPEPSNHHCRGP